nr:LLM class flavin-dependent oxidoreductase [Actinomycetota bacterium]
LWQLWAAGDRKAAAASVPDEVADALVLHGSPASCREQVRAYVQAGVQVPVLAVLPTPEMTDAASLAAILAGLGPAAS